VKTVKWISTGLSLALFSGCASIDGLNGAEGPQLVASARSTPHEDYVEVGVKFSTSGDFFALVSPKRWMNPIKTGGTLSWMNPNAWGEDFGRTGRIFLGEAVVAGVVVAAVAAGGGGGGEGDGGARDPYDPGDNPGNPPDSNP